MNAAPCNPPLPPGGGNGHLAQKASEILGAKEKFYKAPKLICTVILWYRFVVQSPPLPTGGKPSLHDRPPPPCGGGTVATLVGRLQGGGGKVHVHAHCRLAA